jgi:hypothetical protein
MPGNEPVEAAQELARASEGPLEAHGGRGTLPGHALIEHVRQPPQIELPATFKTFCGVEAAVRSQRRSLVEANIRKRKE